MVVEEVQASDSVQYYVDQVQKNKGEISHPSQEIFRKREEINRLESVVPV